MRLHVNVLPFWDGIERILFIGLQKTMRRHQIMGNQERLYEESYR